MMTAEKSNCLVGHCADEGMTSWLYDDCCQA